MKKLIILILLLLPAWVMAQQTRPTTPVQKPQNTPYLDTSTGIRWFFDGVNFFAVAPFTPPNTVLTGLGMSVVSSTLTVATGTWRIGNVVYTLSPAKNFTLKPRDSVYYRYEAVYATGVNNGIGIKVDSVTPFPIQHQFGADTLAVGYVLITPVGTSIIPPSPTNQFVFSNPLVQQFGAYPWVTTLKADTIKVAGQYIFPSRRGLSGQVLQDDGAGNLFWSNQAIYLPGFGLQLTGQTFSGDSLVFVTHKALMDTLLNNAAHFNPTQFTISNDTISLIGGGGSDSTLYKTNGVLPNRYIQLNYNSEFLLGDTINYYGLYTHLRSDSTYRSALFAGNPSGSQQAGFTADGLGYLNMTAIKDAVQKTITIDAQSGGKMLISNTLNEGLINNEDHTAWELANDKALISTLGAKMLISDSLAAHPTGNIYNIDGTLTGNRAVNLLRHSLSFATSAVGGSNTGFGIDTVSVAMQATATGGTESANVTVSNSGSGASVAMQRNYFGTTAGISLPGLAGVGAGIHDGLGYGLFYDASSDYVNALADPSLNPLLILPKEANDLLYAPIGVVGTFLPLTFPSDQTVNTNGFGFNINSAYHSGGVGFSIDSIGGFYNTARSSDNAYVSLFAQDSTHLELTHSGPVNGNSVIVNNNNTLLRYTKVSGGATTAIEFGADYSGLLVRDQIGHRGLVEDSTSVDENGYTDYNYISKKYGDSSYVHLGDAVNIYNSDGTVSTGGGFRNVYLNTNEIDWHGSAFDIKMWPSGNLGIVGSGQADNGWALYVTQSGISGMLQVGEFSVDASSHAQSGTASPGDNSTRVATTAFVTAAISGISSGITALTGDVTASGTGSVAATLATVNFTTGSFGDATHVGSFAVNGKGLITAASSIAITFPVTASNSVAFTNKTGNISQWTNDSGYITTISGIAAGGELAGTYPNPTLLNSAVIAKVLTGYSSGAGTVASTDNILQAIQKLNGNDALRLTNPLTTTGDIIYSSSGSTAARLAIGGANTVLHGGTTPSYSSVANADLANSTISGVALGSNLAALTATNSTLTFSGSYTGATARDVGINLSTANSWGANIGFSANATYNFGSTGNNALNTFTNIVNSNTSLTLATSAANSIIFSQNSAESARFNASGRLLIGATTDDGAGKVQAYNNGIATTITNGITIANTTASLVGTTRQISPGTHYGAHVWNTTATAADNWADWIEYADVTSGLTPTTTLTWASSRTTTSTPSYTTRMTLDNSGLLSGVSGLTATGTVTGNGINGTTFVQSPTITAPNNNQTLAIGGTRTFNAANTAINLNTGSITNSTGQINVVSITPIYNQTSTAAATDLLINRTQTAVGSGAQLLIDAQVSNTSKFSVSNTGLIQSQALTASKVVFTDASKNLTSTGIGTSSQLIAGDGSLVSAPLIQGSADLTAQTAAGNITTFTVGASTATFNISSYINVTAVSVDVIQGQITYTDENNTAQTVSLANISAIGNSSYSPVTIRAKNATVITVKTNLTTGAGSITFDAGARITQF